MYGTYGSSTFGSTGSGLRIGKTIALIGDPSTHGGTLISHNQDGRFRVNSGIVAVNGAQHSCPIPLHGTTSVTAITVRSKCNGRFILTTGAVAGCGAIIRPADRKVYCE